MTRKQAEKLQTKLSSNPQQSAADAMLERLYVTADQLQALQQQLAEDSEPLSGKSQGLDTDFDVEEDHYQRPPSVEERRQHASSQGQGAPGQALSVNDLNRGDVETPEEDSHHSADTVEEIKKEDISPDDIEYEKEVESPAATEEISAHPKTLAGFLKLARHWGCSDLHLSVGRPPFVRLNGQLRYMEMDPLTPEKSEEFNLSLLTEEERAEAEEVSQLDFALEIKGVGRHRCNIFRQRLGWDGSYRIVSRSVPKLEQLGLPASLRFLTEYNQGLVMVTGPGGSGKTTTVAGLIDIVNGSRRDHIITVEDPVEYIIPPKQCQITQREVGRHTESFGNALRAALREDPDVISIGEMRDLETTSIAISAAETGHLVFGTLHTGSAVRTVSRIVDVYPLQQQRQVGIMVAESLRGVISQQLIPRKDADGRVLAYEVLVNTTGVATQIKEGKTHMIQSLMQSGKRQGMVMMEEVLMHYYNQGVISGRNAYLYANSKQQFESKKNED